MQYVPAGKENILPEYRTLDPDNFYHTGSLSLVAIAPEYGANDNSGINYFSAWVESHMYFGEFREYRVRLENSDITLSVITSPDLRHSVGDRLYLAIPPECCRLVPRSSKIATQSTEKVLAMTS